MIYVPFDDVYNKCFVVQSEGVVRAYDRLPQNNTNYNYRDFYVNSSYMYRDGTGNWSSYTSLPICLDTDIITHTYVYRNDFPSILLTFVLFVGFIYFLLSKLFKPIFRSVR